MQPLRGEGGRRSGEEVMGAGMLAGPSALALETQSKGFFHTPLNTCCHWQMWKCVNTLEARGETKAGLGIVMCKRQPLSNRAVCVRMKRL